MESWKLELHLTLQETCFISIAKCLWKQADAEIKIENYIWKNAQPYHTSDYNERRILPYKWFDVENYVLRKVKKLCLPDKLRSELELCIILLGDKIHSWLEYVVEKYKLDVSSAVKSLQLWEAAKDMEAERCSYLLMNQVEQQKNVSKFDYFNIALILANNKLSEKEKNLFVENYPVNILQIYLLNYGFQKFFRQVFCTVKKFLTAPKYRHLILTIISNEEFYLASKKSAAVDIRQNFVKSAFLLLWGEITLEMKKKILEQKLLEFLIPDNDTVIWKIIYNDKSLECYKNNMHFRLLNGLCCRPHCAARNWLMEIDFIDRLKLKNLYIFKTIIYEGDFYSVDFLAFFLGYSDEEIINNKLQFDSSRICDYFINKHQWVYIDKYLKWRFDSEQEVETFKNRYKTNEFIYKILMEIWNDRDKLTAFLFWLFESEENIVKYKMENPGIAEDLIISNLGRREFFSYFEPFMKYWLLSSEHMSQLKELIVKYKK